MTLAKIICTPLKTLRSLKNSVLVISIFYRLTKVGRYFYTQILYIFHVFSVKFANSHPEICANK